MMICQILNTNSPPTAGLKLAKNDDDVDSDIDEEYRASERYKACDEDITAEDEMDLAQVYAGDVEMVDDVGSLAQSLGASHLGRSLMLQDEHMGNNMSSNSHHVHYICQLENESETEKEQTSKNFV